MRFLLLFCLYCTGLSAQEIPVTLYTVDAVEGTALPFVNVQAEGISVNGTTDADGLLELQLPAGRVTLLVSCVGYELLTRRINVEPGMARVSLPLYPTAATLETVTVTSDDASDRLERPVLGVERLSVADIELLPVALGEVDVFKGLQLIGGVSSAGEASNGLSVRGGTIDQNLVLFDGAPIFTPTHLFGLFSVFTPDAIGSVDLYRANIPARFGGRVSSVLDVRSRNPTADKLRMQGGIGLVSSHLSLETPLTKDKKLKLLVGGRAGFNDFVFDLVDRLKNTESRFFDTTLKLRYAVNENNLFTLSGFYSYDYYQIDLQNRFNGIVADQNINRYYTLNGTAEWLKIFNERLSLQTQLVSSNHEPSVLFPQRDVDTEVRYSNRIQYRSLRSALDYTSGGSHHLSGGVQVLRYDIAPGELMDGGVGVVAPVSLAEEQSVEASLFVEDEWTVNPRLTISAGLRYTHYRQLGGGVQWAFDDPVLREEVNLENSRIFEAGEVMQTYGGLEPRLGLSYQPTSTLSLKLAYARGRQYLQNIFNATTPLPTSRWALASNNLLPQQADIYSTGLLWAPRDSKYELSVEGYYRTIDNLLEYRPGAEFFLNPIVETEILQGEGRAYGVEFGLRRKAGLVTGEVNYTYARSENRVEGPTFSTRINDGDWYNGYFDQPHTFNANLTLDRGATNSVSFNFVVQSNRPYTVPNGFVSVDGTPVPIFLERNNARLPVYHRLDFSWRIHNPKMLKRRWVGDWTFTVYNLYGRDNAYNIYYQPRGPNASSALSGGSPLAAYRLTIFGAPIVSLGYSFKFE